MRRLLAALCGALMLGGSIGVAAAAPINTIENWLSVGCGPVATPLGSAFVGAWTSDLYGADASLDIYLEPEPVGSPILGRNWDEPADAQFGDGTFTATIPLIDSDGASSTAMISGTYVVVPGTLAEGGDRFRFGNRWVRSETAEEAVAVTMTISLPGLDPIDADPASCGGARGLTTTFETNPNAFTDRWAAREVVCDLAADGGATGGLFLETFGDSEVFLELWGTSSGGQGFYGVYIGAFVGAELSAELDTFLTDPAFVATDPGSIDITLLSTDIDISYYIQNGTGFARVRGVALDVEGSATAVGTTFDLGHCVGYYRDVKQVATNPAGPGPGGKRPANDAPAGAISLKPGDRKTVSTRGTSPALETDMTCLTFIDPFTGEEIHAEGAHSVWYKVTGKGADVTFDTAGSDYDTIVAVYAGSPDVTAEVGCVDDVFFQPIGRTLQASVTWHADAGTTYWVQAGGLVGGVTYGNLKVALR